MLIQIRCHLLMQFLTILSEGIKEAGHQYEIVDLYKIKFNPVFQDMDSAFFVDEDMPKDLFQQMDMRKMIIELAGGPIKTVYRKIVYKKQNR